MPYKAKRAYFSAQLKMFILRKTNKYICVFKTLFTLYSVKQYEILHVF